MKKIIFGFAILLIASAVIFSSCQKDPVEDPKENPTDSNECFDRYDISSLGNVDALSFINANEGWAYISEDAVSEVSSIAHTTDGGKTWKIINETMDNQVWQQNFYFINATTGFMINTNLGVFGTHDKGVTWTTIIDDLLIGQQGGLSMASNATQTVCYSSGERALLYIDNATFTVTNTIHLPDHIGSVSTIMHLTESGALTFGPVRRTDQKWEQLIHIDPAGNWSYSDVGGDEDGSGVYLLPNTAMNFPSENIGYYVGGSDGQHAHGKVYKTTDGGKTWTEIYRLEDHQQSFTLIDFADDLHGMAGSGSAFAATYKTDDGGNTWDRIDCISDKYVLPWTLAYPSVGKMYIATTIHPYERGVKLFTYDK